MRSNYTARILTLGVLASALSAVRPLSALGYRPPAPAACSPLLQANTVSRPIGVM